VAHSIGSRLDKQLSGGIKMPKKTEVIQPFNLRQSEYEKMFEQPIPEELMMHVILIPVRNHDREVLKKMHRKIDSFFPSKFDEEKNNKMRTKPSPRFYFNIISQARTLIDCESLIEPIQERWLVDGVYVQIGFVNKISEYAKSDFLLSGLAMLQYDQNVVLSHSLDPEDHTPHLVPSEIADSFHHQIGDLYRSGRGVWCRELLEYRDMWLIGIRSMLTGVDPFGAYDRFQEAGGRYFLQFPKLSQ
jgi:hypothetical protein